MKDDIINANTKANKWKRVDCYMPAISAHHQFGVLVREKTSEQVRKIIDENREMYNLGLQGPDLLFFYRPFKKNAVSKIGYALHEVRAKEFLTHLYQVRDFTNEALISYVLGVCGHYVLDKKAHPTVNQYTCSSVEHQMLESSFEWLIRTEYAIMRKRSGLLPFRNVDVKALQLVYYEVSNIQLQETLISIQFISRLLEHKWILQIYEFFVRKKGSFTSLCIPKRLEIEEARELLPLLKEAVWEAAQMMEKYIEPVTTMQQFEEYTKYNFNGVLHERGN